MPYLEILLNGGHHGRQDNPSNEIQEEDPYQKEEGRHLGTKGGRLCFHLFNA